jgi:hypothetical protein
VLNTEPGRQRSVIGNHSVLLDQVMPLRQLVKMLRPEPLNFGDWALVSMSSSIMAHEKGAFLIIAKAKVQDESDAEQ